MKTIFLTLSIIIICANISAQYDDLSQKFRISGKEHYDFVELTDTTLAINSANQIAAVFIDPELLLSGDTIKVSGNKVIINGILFNGMNLLQNHKAVNIGSNKGWIDNLIIECIGTGRIGILRP